MHKKKKVSKVIEAGIDNVQYMDMQSNYKLLWVFKEVQAEFA